ncbi:hypothetical protein [Fundidesulfovibrio terrae]|uniref:hypothetical protein n=1 Tax=Fundidesulfovibrio terrae TaxID=2922866 RepID=UPI001FAF7E9F|nr:hypothetical protein [Fundidesulfovibrio terrae]
MSKDSKPEFKRPMAPKTGAIVLFGALAATATATWVLSRLFPLDVSELEKLKLTMTSDGAWMILGAWTIFPAVFAAAFTLMAKGVDPMRVAIAYAGVTYFLQCYAELTARDNVAMWPELLFTAVPTIILYGIMSRYAPKQGDESDSPS